MGDSGTTTVSAPGVSAGPPIVRTKLHRPEPMADTLLRPRLLARLDEALRRRLVLLSAPAGYGKTTLLASWLRQLNPTSGVRSDQTGYGPQVAWLTLDEADNDPRRFLAYVIAALPMLHEEHRARAHAALADLSPPAVAALLADLLNDLAELRDETLLVLDDYHLIGAPAIHEALAFMIDHLPPRAHLVLATRIDPPLPLARLRARGHLAELRAADLCFTPEEMATFLLEVSELTLGRDQLAALADRTEGWPAGLHLTAIALRDRPDQAAFVDSLVGTHRYIVDYLLEDVFARLPAHTQTFLLKTAILSRLCGPLCDALLGIATTAEGPKTNGAGPTRSEPRLATPAAPRSPFVLRPASFDDAQSYSQLIIDSLERDNLFLVPLDTERVWYRYHHLFAEVLRERLLSGTPPEQVATLHRRAGTWYAAHGMLTDAVGHALRAGAIDDVVAIIEPIGLGIAARVGEATLRGWLPAIPPELLARRPRLALLRAWLSLADYAPAEAQEWLRIAEEALARVAVGQAEGIGNVSNLRGEINAVRARLATLAGDAPAVITYAGQALVWLQADNLALRTRVAKDLGYAYMVQRDYGRAEQAFADAMVHGVSAGYPYVQFLAVSDYAAVRTLRGALQDAVDACHQAISAAGRRGDLGAPGAGLPYLALAGIAAERHEFAAALAALAEAAARITPGNTTSYVCLMVVEARVARAQGHVAAALGHLRRARFIAQQRNLIWAVIVLDSLEAQLLIQAGEITTATLLVERSRHAAEPAEFRYFPPAVLFATEHYGAAPFQLRLASARAAADAAALRGLASDLEDEICNANNAGVHWLRIKLRLIQALTFATLGQERQALRVLGRALALGLPEGYNAVFLEEGPALAELLTRARSASELLGGDSATIAHIHSLGEAFARSGDAPPPAWPTPTLSRSSTPAATPEPAPAPAGLPEPLSSREIDVLQLMADGQSNTEIAAHLMIAISTVKSHINNIFGKLGVASRTQAIARARRLGLI